MEPFLWPHERKNSALKSLISVVESFDKQSNSSFRGRIPFLCDLAREGRSLTALISMKLAQNLDLIPKILIYLIIFVMATILKSKIIVLFVLF